MEHVDAPNLQFYCERRRNTYCKLDYNDARRVLYSIADALSFIHRKGITHDDIKPANILYSMDRGPVLIDFGWSSTGLGHCAGSPWYIPPDYEQTGKRGPPGDIFALGVVLLFLLRLIPLPELQSPPLRWHIPHLRGVGPDALKAKEKMYQWLKIVKRATSKLDNVPDSILDKSGGQVVDMVKAMLEFKAKERITAHELFHELRGL
jgi:serine/threonine protein kinase